MKIHNNDITAVILAGGMGRRMGGLDKGLIEYDGRLLVEILIEKLQQQDVNIVINANRNESVYETYGFPVISDKLSDFQGPLAGFATAMAAVDTQYILTLPCDSPLLSDSFVERFIACHNTPGSEAEISVAHDGERLQPVHALINVDLLDSLNVFLESGDRKIDRWYAQHNYNLADFSDQTDMFKNINTPEDQQRLLEQNDSTKNRKR
ncbi:MAG: molybdenum cofactor guanylyltransferase [Gammaproteobacteria bacterium]|jgi:molybdenum cofactor guanylyltransferase